MSRRSPGKRESLDSVATREISVIRSCRNLSALKQVGRQELFLLNNKRLKKEKNIKPEIALFKL